MYLPNIAAFSIVPFPVSPDEFVVAGYYSEGDGGGGTFVWVPVPVSTTFLDYGITFPYPFDSSPGASGYFKRLYSGYINVRWFGAVYDNLTDVSTAVQNAVNSAAANGGTVYFPKGEYACSFHTSNVSVVGDGQNTVLYGVPDTSEVIKILVHYGYKVVFSHFQIYGTGTGTTDCDGIVFDPEDSRAAGCLFEKLSIVHCRRGIYKASGNILNTFIDCMFYGNDIGYLARNNVNPAMHCGADEIIRGGFSANLSCRHFYTGRRPRRIWTINSRRC